MTQSETSGLKAGIKTRGIIAALNRGEAQNRSFSVNRGKPALIRKVCGTIEVGREGTARRRPERASVLIMRMGREGWG